MKTDLVTSTKLWDLQEGLRVASKLSKYLPGWMDKPDVTSLMYALSWALQLPSEEPAIILFDKETGYFISEADIANNEEGRDRLIKAVTVRQDGQLIFHGVEMEEECSGAGNAKNLPSPESKG